MIPKSFRSCRKNSGQRGFLKEPYRPNQKEKKLKSPYSRTVYKNVAELFEAMASPKRLEILNLLKNQELSVTEIAKAMGIRVANVSQHLMALRYLKFVTRKGSGKSVTYKIAKPEILEPFITLNGLIKKGYFKN